MDYDAMITSIANLSHKKFRDIYRKLNNGSRINITKDSLWIKKRGTNKADLAKLSYIELPNDWQFERWSGAKVALDVLLKTVKDGGSLDELFVEYASDIIHKEWLKRNI